MPLRPINGTPENMSVATVPRYAVRLKPTPIPGANWNDAPLFCLKINDEWVSHVLGVLTALDQPDTWQGTPEEIYAARQQVNAIMAALMTACEDCEVEFRINDCHLEWRRSEADEWISLGNVCGTNGIDGADGAPGADGLPGAVGETGPIGPKGDCCGQDDVGEPVTDDGNDNLCGIAHYMVTWVNDVWTDWLQAVQAAAELTNAVADGIAAIPGVGLILQPFIEATKAIAELSDATVDAYLAEADTTFLEQATCDLYCQLKANGYTVGLVYDWAQAIVDNSGTSLGIRTWGAFVLNLTTGEIDKRALIGSNLPQNDCELLCTDCPTPALMHYRNSALEWVPLVPDEMGLYTAPSDQQEDGGGQFILTIGYGADVTAIPNPGSNTPCGDIDIQTQVGTLAAVWDCHTGGLNALSHCAYAWQWTRSGAPVELTWYAVDTGCE